jgi:hypothetical protein
MHFFLHTYSSKRIIKSAINALHPNCVLQEKRQCERPVALGLAGRDAETVSPDHDIFVIRGTQTGGRNVEEFASM